MFVLAALVGAGCSVVFSDNVRYACKTDADCAGDGFTCLAGACCKSSGPEVCGDGVDNDCDGKVDRDDGSAETCNGLDDDCDNIVDNGFNLNTDPNNCGRCGTACDVATQQCTAGSCGIRTETECGNGADDDGNGQTDCADPGCNLLPCGAACLCTGGIKVEQLCSDGLDNDGDGNADCADSDCDVKACANGCTCLDGGARETNCQDSIDNDNDAGADCNDPACEQQFCAPGTTQRCTGTACLCNGGTPTPEAASLCSDGLDNDCDNQTDCREILCDALPCADAGVLSDGGYTCVCANRERAEGDCTNGLDDDRDGMADCADTLNCPAGAACRATVSGVSAGGQCSAGGMCLVEFCFDGADNDNDTQADCADSDCEGQPCSTDGGVGADGGSSCGCIGGVKVERNCRDRFDNDGDNLVDCADFNDCPQGLACTRNNGSAGTCQSNRTCN